MELPDLQPEAPAPKKKQYSAWIELPLSEQFEEARKKASKMTKKLSIEMAIKAGMEEAIKTVEKLFNALPAGERDRIQAELAEEAMKGILTTAEEGQAPAEDNKPERKGKK